MNWIYVAELAVIGFLLGSIVNKKVLKEYNAGRVPAIVLTIAFALVGIRFLIFSGSDLNGQEITDTYKFLQTAVYSAMSGILFVLAYKIKGFDYEAAARKKAGISEDDQRLEKNEKEKESRAMEFIYLVLLLCLGVLAAWLFNDVEMQWWHRAIGLVAASVPFLLMGRKTESVKDGEVLLMATAGVLLGWKNIIFAVFLGIFFSSATKTFKLLTRKREDKGKKLKQMKMAPFLALGIYVAALYGDFLLNWFYGLYMG